MERFFTGSARKKGNAVEVQSVGGPKGAAGPAAYVQDLLLLPRALFFWTSTAILVFLYTEDTVTVFEKSR